MTPAQIATRIRFFTRTSSVTFVDADILHLLNQRIDEVAQAILKTDEDIFLIPQTDDLVLNQRVYAFPSDILSRIKRVSAKFNGTDWIPLYELDISGVSTPIVTEANITDIFNSYQVSNTNPHGARFDIMRKSIKIYSGTISAVTDGLQLWCMTWPAHVTDLSSTTDLSVDPSTSTHSMPRSVHRLLVSGVVIDYKSSREKPIPLSERELNYERDLEKAIETLKHGNLDREVIGELPPASSRWNDGADL